MGTLQFLKTDQDFASFKSSRAFNSRHLKIRVRYLAHQNLTRFGFIVPKKVLPKVVDRNKLKRRIKTVLNADHAKLISCEIIFYPQKELVKVSFTDLSAEVRELFTKAKLWKS